MTHQVTMRLKNCKSWNYDIPNHFYKTQKISIKM